jgi:cytochrome c
MRAIVVLAYAIAAMFFSASAYAGDRATPDEAKAMSIKAAAFLKDNGPEKAFPAFEKDAAWHDRDLYVFVQDSKLVMMSHGVNHALIGKPMAGLKDVDGKPFNLEMAAITEAGWINYKWQNPTTKAVEPKSAYVVRVGEYLVGVGAYVN